MLYYTYNIFNFTTEIMSTCVILPFSLTIPTDLKMLYDQDKIKYKNYVHSKKK